MISKYFKIEELVPSALVKQLKPEVLWGLLDDRSIYTLDALREHFGTAYVNTYPFGGDDEYRGFRPASCKVGAVNSQHRFGRAFDVTFKDVPAEEVRQYVIASKTAVYPKDCAKYITALEEGVSWFHFDTRNRMSDTLLLFKAPKIK